MKQTITPDTLNALAQRLTDARVNASPLSQLSRDYEFSRSDAYQIQAIGLQHRLERGEKLIGTKMGLTSKAKREQMNLDAPLYGVLTDRMQIPTGGEFSLKGSIHPKIEPEVAFLFKRDLVGPKTREEILEATQAVCASLEILDSRYEQFKYFSMEDVIADNSSSSHFILGQWWEDFRSLDLTALEMVLKVNGEVRERGVSSAISGDPVRSVQEQLELRPEGLKAGQFVLAGAATTAIALEAGMLIELEVEGLPTLNVSITA